MLVKTVYTVKPFNIPITFYYGNYDEFKNDVKDKLDPKEVDRVLGIDATIGLTSANGYKIYVFINDRYDAYTVLGTIVHETLHAINLAVQYAGSTFSPTTEELYAHYLNDVTEYLCKEFGFKISKKTYHEIESKVKR